MKKYTLPWRRNMTEQIEEMAKIIDNRLIEARGYLGSMNRGEGYWIAQKLIEHYQPKLPKDSVVLSREEYEMLANQYKALDIKYTNLSDNYRLCKDANEGLKQSVVTARKETANKIFNDIFALINNAKYKSSIIFGNSSDYGKGYKNSVSHFNEHILELAKQYGVEVEE